MNYIDGKQIAGEILEKIRAEVSLLEKKPRLAIIQVGFDEASNIYVKHKVNDAKKVGIETEILNFDSIDMTELTYAVEKLNTREDIHGYIIQLPLPIEGELKDILLKIEVTKDVDGLSPLSIGAIWQKNSLIGFLPATVRAVKETLLFISTYSDGFYGVSEMNEDTRELNLQKFLKSKNVVIINDSLIVGRPLAGLLLNYETTVTICHKNTKDLANFTTKADILVSATGRVGLITSEMIKKKAIVIDVGIKRVAEGVKGDVDSETLDGVASWITPVPNGIGPLTRAMLLQNTLDAYKKQK